LNPELAVVTVLNTRYPSPLVACAPLYSFPPEINSVCQRCRLSAETRRRRALWVASEYIPDVILVFEFQAYLCWFGVWRPQGFRRMDCEAMHRLASEARQGSPEGCFSVR